VLKGLTLEALEGRAGSEAQLGAPSKRDEPLPSSTERWAVGQWDRLDCFLRRLAVGKLSAMRGHLQGRGERRSIMGFLGSVALAIGRRPALLRSASERRRRS
jgi:hypothetical protein